MVESDWMKTVQTAVGSHIPECLPLRVPAVLLAAAVIFFIGLMFLPLNLLVMRVMVVVSFLISASIEVGFSLVWMLAAVLVAFAAPWLGSCLMFSRILLP